MGCLTGRRVIVTGAARGIGCSIAETLLREGARVALADILEDEVQAAAESLSKAGDEAIAVSVNIADVGSTERMVEQVTAKFGGVDALVNNAGLDAPRGRAWDIDETHWRQVLDVNLSGQWWCTKAVLPSMIEQHSGRIVFISSVAARQAGASHTTPAYATAKAGLIGLTIALSAQVSRTAFLSMRSRLDLLEIRASPLRKKAVEHTFRLTHWGSADLSPLPRGSSTFSASPETGSVELF